MFNVVNDVAPLILAIENNLMRNLGRCCNGQEDITTFPAAALTAALLQLGLNVLKAEHCLGQVSDSSCLLKLKRRTSC